MTFLPQPSDAQLDKNPANPKFGLIFSPTENTTLRFAAFRALKRGIIQKQTLEPTQVAGFNQFYDDPDGTLANKIGFGVDHKLSNNLFMGAEFSRRELDLPVPSVENLYYFGKTNWAENNARSYLNWTLSSKIAVGLNYNFEELQRKKDGFFETTNGDSNFFSQLNTHRTQVFGNFFHPSGLLSKLSLSYLNQTGTFLNDDGSFSPQATDFWLLDAEIGYRLPNRHGLLAIGVKNLLDERFNFQGTDVNNPRLPQGSLIFSRVTLSF
ncbi:porin family protein [Methylosoma difficile]